ncbi:hypothetical protein L1049_008113 [Liquidambar formosana]|uniref:Uncharacterized protein n=1 Tax=Liquidambar formosana TaxID=63359 RepID=A0AAP0S9C4_LIQFO
MPNLIGSGLKQKRKMGLFRPSLLLLLLILLIGSPVSHKPQAVEARLLPFLSQQRESRIFTTLGLVCKCCDGSGGECTSTWSTTCS